MEDHVGRRIYWCLGTWDSDYLLWWNKMKVLSPHLHTFGWLSWKVCSFWPTRTYSHGMLQNPAREHQKPGSMSLPSLSHPFVFGTQSWDD
jgi:hypothetical protein